MRNGIRGLGNGERPAVIAPQITASFNHGGVSFLSVEFITPPGMSASPVFSRVARMGAGPAIYFSSLYGDSNRNAVDETLEIFDKLGH